MNERRSRSADHDTATMLLSIHFLTVRSGFGGRVSRAVQMSFPSHNFLLHMLLGMLGDVLPSVCPGSDSGFSPKGGTGAKNINHFKNNFSHQCLCIIVAQQKKYIDFNQSTSSSFLSCSDVGFFNKTIYFLQVIKNFSNIYSAIRPAGQAMLEMNLFIQSVL